MPSTTRRPIIALAALAAALLLTGCGSSTSGSAAPSSAAGTGTSAAVSTSGSGTGAAGGGEVTLITHDSFVVDDAMLSDFEAATGLTVTVLAQGDAGAMVNQLLLTASNPLGDAVFGIDNTFASRALDAGILAPYTSPAAGAGASAFAIDDRLTAVDYGDVCVNIDHA